MTLDELRQTLLNEGDRVLDEAGYYLVDVEVEASRSTTLVRFFIDRESSRVDVADCARASRQLDGWLEESRLLGEDYGLEVSSPGLERRVARPRDYKRFVGREVSVRLKETMEGKRKFVGTIEDADDGAVTIRTPEGSVTLSYARIARANLTYDFSSGEGA